MEEFKITDSKELEAITKFKEKHRNTCRIENEFGFPLGPLFSYIFTPTGIGVAKGIRCSKCKEELNITNYDIW